MRFLEPGHLRPSDAGGELIPSPFVGQAGNGGWRALLTAGGEICCPDEML